MSIRGFSTDTWVPSNRKIITFRTNLVAENNRTYRYTLQRHPATWFWNGVPAFFLSEANKRSQDQTFFVKPKNKVRVYGWSFVKAMSVDKNVSSLRSPQTNASICRQYRAERSLLTRHQNHHQDPVLELHSDINIRDWHYLKFCLTWLVDYHVILPRRVAQEYEHEVLADVLLHLFPLLPDCLQSVLLRISIFLSIVEFIQNFKRMGIS